MKFHGLMIFMVRCELLFMPVSTEPFFNERCLLILLLGRHAPGSPATVESPDMISMEIRVNPDISISLKIEVPCIAKNHTIIFS